MENTSFMEQITPAASRCGHNFEIPKCPYKHCGARELYEAVKMAERAGTEGGYPTNSEENRQMRAALATAAPQMKEQVNQFTQCRNLNPKFPNRAVPEDHRCRLAEGHQGGCDFPSDSLAPASTIDPDDQDPDRPPAEWPAQLDERPPWASDVPADPIERYLQILTPEQEAAIEPSNPVLMAIAVGVLNAAKELRRIASAMERGADELHG
jgi:hypothetical protein